MGFLIDFLFPRRCLGCGKRGQYFCPQCLPLVKPLQKQICPVCEKPAISGKTHARCQTKYSLDGLISVFPYQGPIKEAITQLKYKFVTDLAQKLGELITASLQTQISNSQFIIPDSSLLIPVPLHPRRRRWRGFNQVELLGEMLAEKLNWSLKTNLLLRPRFTQPQVRLKGKKRKANIRGAFKLNPQYPLNSLNILVSQSPHIFIFDDVWTTGATLKEAGRVLKRAGFQKVWGLTIAR